MPITKEGGVQKAVWDTGFESLLKFLDLQSSPNEALWQ